MEDRPVRKNAVVILSLLADVEIKELSWTIQTIQLRLG